MEHPARSALDVLDVGVAVLDRDWVYRYVNPRAAEILGTTVDAMLGHHYATLFPAAVGSPFEQTFQRVMASGRAEVIEEFHQARGRSFRARAAPVDIGIAIFFDDVTAERTKADAAARERSLLQQVVDSIPAAIVLQDLEGRYQLVNKIAAFLLSGQVPRVDPVGHVAADVVDPARAASWTARRDRALATLAPVLSEAPGVQPDGEHVIYQSVVFPTYDELGSLSGVGGVGMDVTALRRAEAKLAAVERRYRDLFEQAGLGQVIGRQHGEIIDVNRALCLMLGLRREELLARPVAQLLVLGAHEAAAVQQGEATFEFEQELTHADGHRVPVRVTVSLMADPVEGGRPLVSAIVRDETDVHRIRNDQQRSSAELHEAILQRHDLLARLVDGLERERARIAAEVHDDSVQALAAVEVRLSAIKDRLLSADPALMEAVEQLQASVAGAMDRLRRLLFDLEPISARVSLLDALRDVAAYTLEDVDVRWALVPGADVDLDYPERVKAIRIAKEALANVREHAHAKRVIIDVVAVEHGVQISVVDDGVGLDPDRAASPAGHRGLTTMRDRAAIAGGWWRLERAPGGGTAVVFWLPSQAPSEPAAGSG